MRLMPDGRLLRYMRSKYADINTRLWHLWEQYGAGSRSTSSLLCVASRLHFPCLGTYYYYVHKVIFFNVDNILMIKKMGQYLASHQTKSLLGQSE